MRIVSWLLGAILVFGMPAVQGAFLCRQVHAREAGLRWKPVENYFLALRTNPRHYWTWFSKDTSKVPASQRSFLTEGHIAGDFHYQNLSARLHDGKVKVDFMDLDDSGHGPFALDLVRFLVTNQAVDVKVKTGDLIEAYVEGLQGDQGKTPRRIVQLEEISEKKIAKSEEKFVEKNTDREGLRFKKLGLERVEEQSPEVQQQALTVAAAMGARYEGKVLSTGIRRKATGGSQGLLRVWALIETPTGSRIFEAKQIAEPALSAWGPQGPVVQRIHDLIGSLWGEHPTDYGVLQAAGLDFWIRPRGPKYFKAEFPEANDKDRVERFENEMLSFARYLGFRHGQQPEAAPYLRAILESPTEFQLSLRGWLDGYDKAAREQFDQQDRP